MTLQIFLRLAGMFLIPLAAILLPILIGQHFGLYHNKKSKNINPTPIVSVISAALGLLAFMLAFTFQMAAERYNTRRRLVLEDATNIRTAYLRAGMLPEPFNAATKNLLVEYVNLRVDFAKDARNLDRAMSRSQQILDTIWKYSETLAVQDRSSEIYALFIMSVNDLVDNYNHRVLMALQYRIPVAVYWVLFLVGFFSMFILGYQFGVTGRKNFWISFVLSVVFALVMLLIFALDRPEVNLIKVGQNSMISLQQQLQAKQNVR